VPVDLKGSVALITGASSGIGKDLALRLAQEGTRTVLTARRGDRLAQVRTECEPHAPSIAIPCDVRERAQTDLVVAEALRHFERIDLLVNNAGYSRWTLAAEAPVEEYEDLMRTNFFGAVYFTKAVLPLMLARRSGHIVNVGSIAGRLGTGHHTHYCATKFAMTGFTESLWYELQGTGVGITLVNPGVIDTELFDHESFANFPAANRARMIPVRVLTEAILEAIRRNRPEITVPRYFALGTLLRHLLPGTFRRIMANQTT
jgi:short-subunit dehydrogenase